MAPLKTFILPDTDGIFHRFLDNRQRGNKLKKFSIHQLCDLVPCAEESTQWIPEDPMHRRLDIDSVTEWELAHPISWIFDTRVHLRLDVDHKGVPTRL